MQQELDFEEAPTTIEPLRKTPQESFPTTGAFVALGIAWVLFAVLWELIPHRTVEGKVIGMRWEQRITQYQWLPTVVRAPRKTTVAEPHEDPAGDFLGKAGMEYIPHSCTKQDRVVECSYRTWIWSPLRESTTIVGEGTHIPPYPVPLPPEWGTREDRSTSFTVTFLHPTGTWDIHPANLQEYLFWHPDDTVWLTIADTGRIESLRHSE